MEIEIDDVISATVLPDDSPTRQRLIQIQADRKLARSLAYFTDRYRDAQLTGHKPERVLQLSTTYPGTRTRIPVKQLMPLWKVEIMEYWDGSAALILKHYGSTQEATASQDAERPSIRDSITQHITDVVQMKSELVHSCSPSAFYDYIATAGQGVDATRPDLKLLQEGLLTHHLARQAAGVHGAGKAYQLEQKAGAVWNNVTTCAQYKFTDPHDKCVNLVWDLLVAAEAGTRIRDSDQLRFAAVAVLCGLRCENADNVEGLPLMEFFAADEDKFNDSFYERLEDDVVENFMDWDQHQGVYNQHVVMLDRSKGDSCPNVSLITIPAVLFDKMGGTMSEVLRFIELSSRSNPRAIGTPVMSFVNEKVINCFRDEFHGLDAPHVEASYSHGKNSTEGNCRSLSRMVGLLFQIGLKSHPSELECLGSLPAVDICGIVGAQNGDALDRYRQPYYRGREAVWYYIWCWFEKASPGPGYEAIGWRVTVYFDDEDEWFEGTIVDFNGILHCVNYDQGGEVYEDLTDGPYERID